jgi:hypothetical protein
MPLSLTVLIKYKDEVDTFIETGTFYGQGVDIALLCGFNKIFSVEVGEFLYRKCLDKFRNLLNDRVFLSLGDSPTFLNAVLKSLDEKCVFWLDAHYSGEGTSKANKNNPILDELDEIKGHHIKNHTILIDDVRLFGTSEFDDITLDDVVSKLKEINPGYVIKYEAGHVPKDILVATIVTAEIP